MGHSQFCFGCPILCSDPHQFSDGQTRGFNDLHTHLAHAFRSVSMQHSSRPFSYADPGKGALVPAQAPAVSI